MVSSPQLPPDQHELIFEGIKQFALSQSQESHHPVVIVLAGQPGAGKSGLASMARSRFLDREGCVLIDADKLRVHHPHYATLLAENDLTAANLTHDDAGRWASRLLRVATAARRNIVVDQTSKDPARVEALLTRMKSVGYRVEFHVLAVPPAISELRIYARYETQRAIVGRGRFTTKDTHDAALAGLPGSVAVVEQKVLADRIWILDKDHFTVFENTVAAGKWQGSADALQAFKNEAVRPLTLQECRDTAMSYDQLHASVTAPSRQATGVEISTLGAMRNKAHQALHAALFRQCDEKDVVNQFPALAPAYATLNAARAHAASKFQSQEKDQTRFLERVRSAIAERIEAGRELRATVRAVFDQER